MAFVDPIARIAFLVVAMPTQWSSNEGVSLAMFLMKSRALAMVSPVAEVVWTLFTSFSTFCMKNLLHSSAHSLSDLQLLSIGSFSVFPLDKKCDDKLTRSLTAVQKKLNS